MKRKEFEKVKGTGVLKNAPFSLINFSRNLSNLLMCPYTNYIPLSYLLLAENLGGKNYSDYIGEDLKTKTKKALYKGGMGYFLETAYRKRLTNSTRGELSKDTIKDMMKLVNKWLFFDDVQCPTTQGENSYYYRNPHRGQLVDDFTTTFTQFSQRSFSGFVSPYSLYRNTSERGIVKYTPHVLAVVRPEHFMQLKLKYLLTGNIDMSMVVILIDNQLDTTQFPVAGFKSLYKQCKPKILETNAQIWRVPLSFIEENCFLPKFELKEKNIFKRKEEIDSLIQEFYNSERATPIEVGAEMWDTEVLRAGSVGIIEQLQEYATTYTYRTTPFTISTSASGMDLLNAAILESGAIVNNNQPAPIFVGEEFDEDGTNDGPQNDIPDEEWLEETNESPPF